MPKFILIAGFVLVAAAIGFIAYRAGSDADVAAAAPAATNPSPAGQPTTVSSLPPPPMITTSPGGPMIPPPSGTGAAPPNMDLTNQMGGVALQRRPDETEAQFIERVKKEFAAKGFAMPPIPTVMPGAVPLDKLPKPPPSATPQGTAQPTPASPDDERDEERKRGFGNRARGRFGVPGQPGALPPGFPQSGAPAPGQPAATDPAQPAPAPAPGTPQPQQ